MNKRSWILACVVGLGFSLLLSAFGGVVVAQVGTLFVEGDKVGVGIEVPTSTLHVFDDAATVAVRDMMALSNNGGVTFGLENRATGTRWKMGHKFDNDAYVITLLGSGASEFQLHKNGDLTLVGNLSVSGTKNFVTPDPTDSTKRIYFAALEGPEAGTYYRGTADLVNGQVEIELPSHFSKVTEEHDLTVQLTPVGSWSHLYVAKLTRDRLIVRSVGATDARFHFFVQGVRKGYKNYEVVRTE